MTALLRLANDFTHSAKNDAASRAKLGLDLMIEFTDQLGDPTAMAEIQTRFPGIAAMITGIPKQTRVDALKAKQLGQPVDVYAPKIAEFIAAYDKELEGVRPEVGFMLRHRRFGHQLVDDESWKLVQDLRVGRTREARFALPSDTWADVFPGWQGWSVKDDVEDRMRLLGVPRREVDARSERLQGEKSIHVPARDGVLFLDDLCLRDKAKRLLKDDDVPFVRRMRLEGQNRNMFALPAELFLEMRGISYQIPSRSPDAILERVKERLAERGLPDAEVHLKRIGGDAHICLTADDALTLVAPTHPGDAAARLTLETFHYDPVKQDYDPELGVLMTQAAMLAYENHETIRTHANAWGFEEVESFNETDGGLDAQAFAAYDDRHDAIMISFRGSESMDDFRADADFTSVDGSAYGGGYVQEGFEVQTRALIPKLKEFIDRHPNAKIMLGGHSLGGAMAALFQGWCLKNDIHVDQVYTCGQPPVGDEDWQKSVEQLVRDKRTDERPVNHFRYVYGSDPVPHAPKFWHTGTQLYIDEDGKMQDPKSFSLTTGFFSLIGRVWDSIDNSFLHHRCPSYLGIIRKNRGFAPTTK